MKNDELRAKTWVGVVPTWVTYGAPVPSPDNKLSKASKTILAVF